PEVQAPGRVLGRPRAQDQLNGSVLCGSSTAMPSKIRKEASGLVLRAPPGGAAADAVADEGGAVLRADAFGDAFGHEVAGVGAAAVEQALHRLAKVALETAELVVGERPGLAPRGDAGPP